MAYVYWFIGCCVAVALWLAYQDALKWYQARTLRKRQRQIDQELAAMHERQKLDALLGTPMPTSVIRVHVPLRETRRKMRRRA